MGNSPSTSKAIDQSSQSEIFQSDLQSFLTSDGATITDNLKSIQGIKIPIILSFFRRHPSFILHVLKIIKINHQLTIAQNILDTLIKESERLSNEIICFLLSYAYHHPTDVMILKTIHSIEKTIRTRFEWIDMSSTTILYFVMLIYLISIDRHDFTIRKMVEDTPLFSYFKEIASIYLKKPPSHYQKHAEIQSSLQKAKQKGVQEALKYIMSEKDENIRFGATEFLCRHIRRQLEGYEKYYEQQSSIFQLLHHAMGYDRQYQDYVRKTRTQFEQRFKRMQHIQISELDRLIKQGIYKRTDLMKKIYKEQFQYLLGKNEWEKAYQCIPTIVSLVQLNKRMTAYYLYKELIETCIKSDKCKYEFCYDILFNQPFLFLDVGQRESFKLMLFVMSENQIRKPPITRSRSDAEIRFIIDFFTRYYMKDEIRLYRTLKDIFNDTWLNYFHSIFDRMKEKKEYDSLFRILLVALKDTQERDTQENLIQLFISMVRFIISENDVFPWTYTEQIMKKISPISKEKEMDTVYTELIHYLFKTGQHNKAFVVSQRITDLKKRNEMIQSIIRHLLRIKKYQDIPKDILKQHKDVFFDAIKTFRQEQNYKQVSKLLQFIQRYFPDDASSLLDTIRQVEQKVITTPPKVPEQIITTKDLGFLANKWALKSRFSVLTQDKVNRVYQQAKIASRPITLLDILELWYKPSDRYFFFHSSQSDASTIWNLTTQLTRPEGQERDLRGGDGGMLGKGFYITPDLYQLYNYGLGRSTNRFSGSIFILSLSKEDAQKFIYDVDFSFGDRSTYTKFYPTFKKLIQLSSVLNDRLHSDKLSTRLGLKEVVLRVQKTIPDPSNPSKSISSYNPLISLIRLHMVVFLFHRENAMIEDVPIVLSKVRHKYVSQRSSGTLHPWNTKSLRPISTLLFQRTSEPHDGVLQRKIKQEVEPVADVYLKNRQFDKIWRNGNSLKQYTEYISNVLGSENIRQIQQVLRKEIQTLHRDDTLFRVNLHDGTKVKTTLEHEQAQPQDQRSLCYLVYFQELESFLMYMKTDAFCLQIKQLIELFPSDVNVRILFNRFIPPRYGTTMVRCLLYHANNRVLRSQRDRQEFFAESTIRKHAKTPLAFLSTYFTTPQPILVIPPYSKEKDYVDIHSFVRHADPSELQAFFSFSSDVISFAISDLPATALSQNRRLDTVNIVKYREENNLDQQGVFVSFHSGSVGWMHMRIDATPAYYNNIQNWEKYLDNPIYRTVLHEIQKYPTKNVNVKIFTANHRTEEESVYVCYFNQTLQKIPIKTRVKSILYDVFNIDTSQQRMIEEIQLAILPSTFETLSNDEIRVRPSFFQTITTYLEEEKEKTVQDFMSTDNETMIGLVILW